MTRTLQLAFLMAAAVPLWGQQQTRPPAPVAAAVTRFPTGVPIANFAATPSGGPASLFVQFADRSVGEVDTWTWDFGDGTSSNLQNPTHVYEMPGEYAVTLTVSGPGGFDSMERSNAISVSPLPTGFIDELVASVPQRTTGFEILDEDDFVVWVKTGLVWRWHDGTIMPTPMVDISEEVGDWNDHGLHGFLFDPEYDVNGYVYLYYVVDRHHLEMFGTPGYNPETNWYNVETIARITRYTVYDPSDPATTIDPSTRHILVGETESTGIPVCSTTHGVGRLAWGHDGTLLFSCGDSVLGGTLQDECVSSGFMRAEENVEQFRSQLLNSASGKIHRINRFTGDGALFNPYYDGSDPRSWKSRTWTLGLRNPYRFAVIPHGDGPEHDDGPGTLLVGDVGNGDWEELSIVRDAGENLGWPFYEGLLIANDGYFFNQDIVNLDAPNPLFGRPGCDPFFLFEDLFIEDTLTPPAFPTNPCDAGELITNVNSYVHTRPLIAWGHRDKDFPEPTMVRTYDGGGNGTATGIDSPGSPVTGLPFVGNASIGGTWYGGTTFPEPYRNVYFHGDYGEEWIRAFAIDENDQLTAVHEFAANAGPITYLATDPDQNYLYYLRYHSPSALRRISFGANAAPIATVNSTQIYGPSPLRVELSSADSNDPEGAALATSWDFGDSQPWTPLNDLAETVHLYPSEDVNDLVTDAFVTRVMRNVSRRDAVSAQPALASSDPFPETITVSSRAGVMTDGIYPLAGAGSPDQQVVVRGDVPTAGLMLEQERELIGLVFQEGKNQGRKGGWLASPRIEYLHPGTGAWEEVTNLEVGPTQAGDLGVDFETFLFSFDAVSTRAIRLRDGQPSAGPGRFTVAELRVLALPNPAPTGPVSYVPIVTVRDDLGAEGSAATLVSTDNTPPVVQIMAPAKGQSYPVGVETQITLSSQRSDAEHNVGTLGCEWDVELIHDNHIHPEAPINDCASTFTLLPHGELTGDIIYWRVRLTVTDPAGLQTTVVRNVVPQGDCNLNGREDSLDISLGSSLDLDLDGIPDECGEPIFIPMEEIDRSSSQSR